VRWTGDVDEDRDGEEGYPLRLEEVSEQALEGELERRRKLRSQGKCDYCERVWGMRPTCKFPQRHLPPRAVRLKGT
jgi:hypothetical protein